MSKKRLRMFAGPNGSGKSTLKTWIAEKMPERKLFENYINPDEIEAHIRATQTLDFKYYGLNPTSTEVLDFFLQSNFLRQVQLSEQARQLDYADGKLFFHRIAMNSYFASVAANFIRKKLLNAKNLLDRRNL